MKVRARLFTISSYLIGGLLISLSLHTYCFASSEYRLSTGQTLYVPAYSNIFAAPKKIPFHLSTILSIRNTDIINPIEITCADFYDTKGHMIRKYYDQKITLTPLETTYIYISEEDSAGGIGANFIVKWSAGKPVNVPIIECLMIGTRGGQGISFISPGHVIKEVTK